MSELEECGIDKHGYAFMTGGKVIGRAAQDAPEAPPADIGSLQKAFVSVLDWFEGNALTRHPDGPYLLGEHFSLLDIMVISSLERLAAGERGLGSLRSASTAVHLVTMLMMMAVG